MPAELSPSVLAHVVKTGSEAYQRQMTAHGDGAQIANTVMQLGAAHRSAELGTIESKAHSGLIATPVASPATQQS